MNIKTKGYWLGAFLAAICVFSSCTKNDDANDENTVSNNYIVVQSSVLMSGNSQSQKIDLEANCQWKVSYDKGSWTDLEVSPIEGNGNTTVIISSSLNNTESDRYVDLKFSTIDGDLPRVCKVTQQMGDFKAELAFESLESNTVTIPYTGQDKEFTVVSNTSWDADIEFSDEDAKNPWCRLVNDVGTLNGHFTAVVNENQTSEKRTATIKVATKNVNGDKKDISVIVEQSAAPLPVATLGASYGEDGVTISINGKVSSASIFNLVDYGYCISREDENENPPRTQISLMTSSTGSVTEADISTSFTKEDGYTYYICSYAKTIVGITYSDVVELKLPGNTPGNDDNTSPPLSRKQ